MGFWPLMTARVLRAYMASAFPLLPTVPSELAAISAGLLMATARLAAAPVPEAGGGLNKLVPATPLRSKPPASHGIHRSGQASGQGIELSLNRRNLLVPGLQRSA